MHFDDAAATAADQEAEQKRYPVDFQWSSAAPNTNEAFEELKASLLSKMSEDNIFEITGYYFEEETPPEGYENMGFARAERLKALFAEDIPEDRIRLRQRLRRESEEAREGYFEGASFRWVEAEKPIAETVEELDSSSIIVRFPFGSIEKEYDPNVDKKLVEFAERVTQTGEKIAITGHADNIGSTETNYDYGLNRAKAIQDLLVKNGVPAGQISVSSKGETQPEASNDTEEGRYVNRRAVVEIINN